MSFFDSLICLHMIAAGYYWFIFIFYLLFYLLIHFFIPYHTNVVGYFFCFILGHQSYIHPSIFSFLVDNLSKFQWICNKLGVSIDIVEIWFGIVKGQILSLFDSSKPAHSSGVLLLHVFLTPLFSCCPSVCPSICLSVLLLVSGEVFNEQCFLAISCYCLFAFKGKHPWNYK